MSKGKKYRSPQFWIESSTGIDADDHIIYVQASPTNWDERILLKITECDAKNPKVMYEQKLEVHEAEVLIRMLTNAVEHYYKMNTLQQIEYAKNKDEE